MEVDQNETTDVIINQSSNPSVSVSLHPLVILNISEQWTRARVQIPVADAPKITVFGALLGKQNGRDIELINSFEISVNEENKIHLEHYRQKETLYQEVNAELQLMGWYSTGDELSVQDLQLHRQVCELVEGPLLLKLDPKPSGRTDRLPIQLYESALEVSESSNRLAFIPLSYTLCTEEAERIGVDHVARNSRMETGPTRSTASDQLQVLLHAVEMLNSRVEVLQKYVSAVSRGDLPRNAALLRRICSLTGRLGLLQSSDFYARLYTQCNDVSLTVLLGRIAQSCITLQQFSTQFAVLYEKKGQKHSRREFLPM